MANLLASEVSRHARPSSECSVFDRSERDGASRTRSVPTTFRTLSTLSRLQEATGDSAEAAKSMEAALDHPTAGPFDVHGFARQLQAAGKNEEAMRVFQLNARKHPGVWPTAFGLARGHAGLGHKAQALEKAREAMAQAPDEQAKAAVEGFIKQLEGAAG